MGVTFGFYNSINGDRRYNAEQMSSIFDGMLNDGVFESIGDGMIVNSDNMNLRIGTGRAWFNNTWTVNDSILILPVDPSEIGFDRLDVVILEINSSEDVRANSFKIVKGTPASEPIAATLIHTDFIHQYPLAYIDIAAEVTEITSENITNKIGTVDCPFAKGILRTIDTEIVEGIEDSIEGVYDAMDGVNDNIAVVNNKLALITTTGSANAYLVAYPTPILTYYVGMIVNAKADFSNTGTATLTVDSLATKTIKKGSVDGNVILEANDMVLDGVYTFMYDGTDMILLNPSHHGMLGEKVIITATGTTTFTATKTGWHKVTVTGGGGSGGKCGTNSNYYSGGGAPGGASIKLVLLNKNDTVTVTIGVGGVVPGESSSGGTGGTSSFGIHCSATGGGGGSIGGSSANGGSGGTGSGGDIDITSDSGHTVFQATNIIGTLEKGSTRFGLSYGKGGSGATGSNSGGSAGGSGIIQVEW